MDLQKLKFHSANITSYAHLFLNTALTAVVLYLGVTGQTYLTHTFAGLWLLFASLDMLDGKLARKYKVDGQGNRIDDNGATLDQVIDKWTSNPAFFVLAFLGELSWYFAIIMCARDIFTNIIRKRVEATSGKSPIKSAGPIGKIKTGLQNITIAAALLPVFPAKPQVVFFLAAFSAALSIVSGMGYLLLAVNHKDNSWLKGTDGKIGTPNWWTISRISIAPIITYVYVVRPFGTISYIVGTILMLAAFLTDTIDGWLARTTTADGRDRKTKAGAALDMLADKLIFYFSFIGIGIATGGGFMLPDSDVLSMRIVYAISLTILVLHDVLFISGYAVATRVFKLAPTSNNWDRVRFWISGAWIVIAGLCLSNFGSTLSISPALKNAPTAQILIWSNYATLLICVILSCLTAGMGYAYIKRLIVDRRSGAPQ